MKWPADRLYNHLPWGWSCILPCQKIPLSWLFSGPWNCRSSDHLLFKIFSQKHKKAIYIIIIWHRKITPVHSIRNFYLQKKHVFPQITESWFSNKKGWRVNLQPNHQHHKKPGYCVCVPATSHLPLHDPPPFRPWNQWHGSWPRVGQRSGTHSSWPSLSFRSVKGGFFWYPPKMVGFGVGRQKTE